MGGGGKTTQSTQGVTIPPDVLARYNSVNANAQTTAATPFQKYSGQFVAPINSTQQSGITQAATSATEAQPYYGAATNTIEGAQSGVSPLNSAAAGLAGASAGQVNAQQIGPDQINQFENPYLSTVLGNTESLINQQNQQAQAGEAGNAIRSGAFGGDREGIAQANLEQQQELAAGNIYSGISSSAFNTALGAAQQQQGVNLGASQANRAALAAAGSELAGIGQTAYGEGANTATTLGSIGAGAQGAAESGAQAELAAGTASQQTAQALDTANYNQFLQQQSYPFQTAQFLANIAEGTGALSGSTTTTTQPGGFFSDERLKEDVKPIGKMFDGQTIVRFRYKGEPHTRIGLIAQDVEKHHPEAVGLHSSGYKVVEHGKATDEAADRGHFQVGGLVASRGGIVDVTDRYAYGGSPVAPGLSGADFNSILNMQQQMYSAAPGAKSAGVRNSRLSVPAGGGGGGGMSIATPAALQQQRTGAQNSTGVVDTASNALKAYKAFTKKPATKTNPNGSATPKTEAPPQDAATSASTTDPGTVDANIGTADSSTATAPSVINGAADSATADSSGLAGAGVDAAGGAAGDAAADAAVDAAAEEAIPAVAADAIAAVARGGSVWKKTLRAGLAGGGMPYSDPQEDNLDIPDENSHNRLITPAASPKPAESGFQQILGLANVGSGLMGGGQSRGGLISRKGRDGGGSIDDDSDSDSPNTGITIAGAAPTSASGSGLSKTQGEIVKAAVAVAPYVIGALAANRGGRVGLATGGRPGFAPGGYPSDYPTDDTTDPSGGLSPPVVAPEQTRTGFSRLMDSIGRYFGASDADRAAEQNRHAAETKLHAAQDAQHFWTPTTDAQAAAEQATVDQARSGLVAAQSGSHVAAATPPAPAPAPAPAPTTQARSAPAPAPDVAPTTPGTFLTYTNPAQSAPAGGLSPPAAPPVPTDVSAPVTTTSAPQTAPAASGAPTAATAPTGLSGAASGVAGAAKGFAGGLKDKLGDIWHGLKSADSDTLQGAIPLLSGLAAMGTAPTRHLGVALAAGLGAGTDSYVKTKSTLADIAKTQAQTGLTGATQDEVQQQAAAVASGIANRDAFRWTESLGSQVHLADGNWISQADWHGQPTWGSAQAKAALEKNSGVRIPANTAVAARSASRGQVQTLPYPHPSPSQGAMSRILNDANSTLLLDRNTLAASSANSLADEGAINASAESARQTGTNLNYLGATIGGMSDSDFQHSGALSQLKQTGLAYAVDLAKTLGYPVEKLPDIKNMDSITEANKLSAMLQFETTANSGQHSQFALDAAHLATPNSTMTRSAALDMVSNMMVEKQRAIDLQHYESEAKAKANSMGYRSTSAREQFRTDYSEENYQRERLQLRKVLDNHEFFNAILTGKHGDGTEVSRDEHAALNASPVSRYIYNR